MGLFFNKSQDDEEKGLLGVRLFLETLRKDLLDNKELRKLYDLRKIKAETEILILKKNFTAPNLEEYQKLLSENEEGRIISEIRNKYTRPIKRIIPILLKIKERERYRDSWKTTELLINVLNFVFETKFLKNLEKKLAIEAKAIRKNNFDIFLRTYQEEKILLMDFNDYLKEIGGDFVGDEIVRAGFNFESAERSLFSAIKSDLTEGTSFDKLFLGTLFSIVGMCFVGVTYIAPLEVTITFSTVAGAGKGLFMIFDALDRKDLEKRKLSARSAMYAVLDEVSKRADEWSAENVELAKEISGKYDIFISGEFSNYDLRNLGRALKQYYPEEVKRFLDKVVFINKSLEELDYRGAYYADRKLIEICTDTDEIVIDHELAHARTDGLPDSFVKKWKEINDKGVPYNEVQKLATKNKWGQFYLWTSGVRDENTPRYGYSRAYGVTNPREDIATFTEMIVSLRWKILNNNEDGDFKRFLPIYIAKLQLLYKFGLATKQDVERLLAHWKSVE